ncbi:MAG: DUF4440 domain-containing protein [Gemmatimonadetes bacterium]|nr:DUF4440 domain-containing protein [Gemmatimonadota bacterium]
MPVALWLAGCTIEHGDVRTPSGEPPEADSVRVRETVEAIAAALEGGDLVALDSIYHDSVLVYEGGGVDRGWAVYRDGHLRPELEALTDLRFRFDDIRVRLADGTAWVTCRYALDALHDGQAVSARGVATLVFRELGRRWRLVHIHTSSARE